MGSLKSDEVSSGRHHAPEAVSLLGEEISVGAVHALNNLLTTVFAASAYLDEPDDPQSVDRARNALKGAAAAGQTLGAGLFLLGLDERSLEKRAVAGGRAERLSGEDFRWIFKSVENVATIRAGTGVLQMPARNWPLDAETLKALLVSMAASVNLTSGGATALNCTVSLSGRSGIRFDISLEHAEDAKPVPAWHARHPCLLAMERFVKVLPSLGCRMDRDSESCVLEMNSKDAP